MTDEDAVKQARQLVDAITNLSDQQALIADLLRDVVMKALPSLRAEQQAALDGLQKLTATRRLIKCGHVRRWHCDFEGRLISREGTWRRCFDGQMQGGVAQGIGWALPPMSAVANALLTRRPCRICRCRRRNCVQRSTSRTRCGSRNNRHFCCRGSLGKAHYRPVSPFKRFRIRPKSPCWCSPSAARSRRGR